MGIDVDSFCLRPFRLPLGGRGTPGLCPEPMGCGGCDPIEELHAQALPRSDYSENISLKITVHVAIFCGHEVWALPALRCKYQRSRWPTLPPLISLETAYLSDNLDVPVLDALGGPAVPTVLSRDRRRPCMG